MTAGRSVTGLAGVTLLSFLTAGPCAAAGPAAPGSPDDLTRVWQLVREDFFDPDLQGVDWDAAYARHHPAFVQAGSSPERAAVINEMLAELRTSHTRFYTAAEPAYYFLFDLFGEAVQNREALERRFPERDVSYVGLGLFTADTAEGTFAKAVVEGGPAAAAGVLAGDRIVSLEGGVWTPVLPADRAGRPLELRVQRQRDGPVLTLTVRPARIRPLEFYLEAIGASARTIEREGKSIGYVRMWSFTGQQYQDALAGLVTTGPLAAADALIVDLRDGWGGASPLYLNLFNGRMPEIRAIGRDGAGEAYRPVWAKPVALLVDETTRSGKELLAFGFQRYGYGPVAGTTTAGAVTGGRAYAIGDDGLLYLATLDVRIDGERLEGRGVTPDLAIPRDLPFSAGNDPQIEGTFRFFLQFLRESSMQETPP